MRIATRAGSFAVVVSLSLAAPRGAQVPRALNGDLPCFRARTRRGTAGGRPLNTNRGRCALLPAAWLRRLLLGAGSPRPDGRFWGCCPSPTRQHQAEVYAAVVTANGIPRARVACHHVPWSQTAACSSAMPSRPTRSTSSSARPSLAAEVRKGRLVAVRGHPRARRRPRRAPRRRRLPAGCLVATARHGRAAAGGAPAHHPRQPAGGFAVQPLSGRATARRAPPPAAVSRQ